MQQNEIQQSKISQDENLLSGEIRAQSKQSQATSREYYRGFWDICLSIFYV